MLVDSQERVYITDFGLAVYKDGQSGQFGSERVSHNAWKAPELLDLLSTSIRPTAKSDMYSYAFVCIEASSNTGVALRYTDRAGSSTQAQLHIYVMYCRAFDPKGQSSLAEN